LAAVLGHRAPEILVVSIAAVVGIGLHPLSGILGLTVQHDRRLCERCVSSMPLNPSERATRYHRRFWTAHTGSEPRFLVPYLAVLVGSNFATSTPGRIAWAVIQMSMIYLILAHTTHRRLQPWCPWCQGGDGGDDHDPATPDPLPWNRRQLV
jgi:hypothetical protein